MSTVLLERWDSSSSRAHSSIRLPTRRSPGPRPRQGFQRGSSVCPAGARSAVRTTRRSKPECGGSSMRPVPRGAGWPPAIRAAVSSPHESPRIPRGTRRAGPDRDLPPARLWRRYGLRTHRTSAPTRARGRRRLARGLPHPCPDFASLTSFNGTAPRMRMRGAALQRWNGQRPLERHGHVARAGGGAGLAHFIRVRSAPARTDVVRMRAIVRRRDDLCTISEHIDAGRGRA